MEMRVLNKNGVSLLEVTAALFIVGAILAMLMPNYVSRIKNAKYQKTISELTAIAQASADYYLSQGVWPTEIKQLVPQYMPNAVTLSPYGTIYQIICVNNMVTASVLIPSGIAQKNPQGQLLVINNEGAQDQIEISKPLENEFSSRLNYDLKYGSQI